MVVHTHQAMSAATASDAATPMAKHGTPNGHWRRQRPVSHEDARRQKLIDEGSKLLKKARHAPKTTIDDQIWAAYVYSPDAALIK